LIRKFLIVLALLLTVAGAVALVTATFGIPSFDWLHLRFHLGYLLPALGALLLVVIAPSGAVRGRGAFGLGLALLATWIWHSVDITREGEGAFIVFLVPCCLILPAAIIVTLAGGVLALRQEFSKGPVPGSCTKCGYDLRGLPEPRCPECGTPFDPTSAPTKPVVEK